MITYTGVCPKCGDRSVPRRFDAASGRLDTLHCAGCHQVVGEEPKSGRQPPERDPLTGLLPQKPQVKPQLKPVPRDPQTGRYLPPADPAPGLYTSNPFTNDTISTTRGAPPPPQSGGLYKTNPFT